jgi:hypothetical protein
MIDFSHSVGRRVALKGGTTFAVYAFNHRTKAVTLRDEHGGELTLAPDDQGDSWDYLPDTPEEIERRERTTLLLALRNQYDVILDEARGNVARAESSLSAARAHLAAKAAEYEREIVCASLKTHKSAFSAL